MSEEEELSPRENFVIRLVIVSVLAFGVLMCWVLYLGLVHSQWEQGLVEYYVYYLLREQSPTVYMIVNTIIIVGGIILIARAWWEIYVREDIPKE